MRDPRTTVILVALAGAVLVPLVPVAGQQVHRNGFEGREVAWTRGTADAAFREVSHVMTDATAHTGQLSEGIQLVAEPGSYIYYFYPTSRAPISDELNISLWLKANRPGIQLLARIVLPHERNPQNLEEPVTVTIRGDAYQLVSRWQRMEVRRPVKLLKEQQQFMRSDLKREVDVTDAHIDRLILNLHSGPGQTQVWIDDLELGPVLESNPFQPTSRPPTPARSEPPAPGPGSVRPSVVELNQDQLLVNGRRFFFRGIRHTDTPLKVLRDAGFNTVWLDSSAPGATLDEAVNLGFWVVPTLTPASTGGGPIQGVNRLLEKESILFWDLGGGLADEQAAAIGKTAQLVRAADPQRPLAADVWDGFRPYARHLDLVGVHRWPLLTGMELTQYRDWLNQRRQLARPGTFLWTWVQTHLPDWYTTLIYDRPAAAGFDEPVGPQPEQVQLLTYLALAGGCRGLGFWSDRFLADSHQGRDRLLSLALLNLELKMLEPLLVAAEPPTWIDTSQPEVKAAVLRTDRGVLVLPMWLGRGAQFVPGQSTVVSLTLVIPQVPVGMQAWEVTPADVHCLRTERVIGGMRLTIPEFSLTSAVVFTADNTPNGLVVRLQDQARQTRQLAAQWAYDQAHVQLEKVTRLAAELERTGHGLPDGQALLAQARERLQVAEQYWKGSDFRKAYAEALRVVRPLRILMRAHWEQAVRGLDATVASPYAVSFYTLHRHWPFMEQVRQASVRGNVLPQGGFEESAGQPQPGWQPQQATLDDVELTARRVAVEPKEGTQCLRLEIAPRNRALPPAALERTFLAVTSPTVQLEPGRLVQVSGWVRIPAQLTATADGALFYDSAGGEPLGIRLTQPTPWKKFTLYRRVPLSGSINVTVALTGLGAADFDDIRIEPLDEGLAREPRPGAPATPVSRTGP